MRDNNFSKNRKSLNRSAIRSSKIASLFIVFLIIICQFPLNVKAESSEYFNYSDGSSIYTGFSWVDGRGNRYPQSCQANHPFYQTYIFSGINGDAYLNRCLVFLSEEAGAIFDAGGPSWVQTTYSDEYSIYYYFNKSTSAFVNDGTTAYLINSDISSLTDEQILDFIMPYFGGNTTNWGNPADVNISTIYSGNVTNSPTNIDKFTWNNEYTTTGISIISNLLDHPVVQIQAVPVTWKTSTREEMENQTGADATIGSGVVLKSINARTGHLEVTWQEVIDYLQIEYANIYSYFFDGEYWIMKGWFYQIRLVADGYEGEWITLSNGLNLSPKKSKKLIEDPYDETIYNLLKEISETNNQTTTVYEYGDNNYITINNDPSSGWQDPDGGGSFWDFLASVIKAISDGIANIVSSVTSLVGDIIDGLLGLFTFDNFTINNYDTEVQNLKDNSGIFGQSIEFADSIKDSIRGVEQQPAVLHFDGIVIDDFQLIPAVDLDFDQMVIDAGLTDFHNLVYVFTDGAILISLIIMVHHKIMEVLRK